jgi:hypothetical protein
MWAIYDLPGHDDDTTPVEGRFANRPYGFRPQPRSWRPGSRENPALTPKQKAAFIHSDPVSGPSYSTGFEPPSMGTRAPVM